MMGAYLFWVDVFIGGDGPPYGYIHSWIDSYKISGQERELLASHLVCRFPDVYTH